MAVTTIFELKLFGCIRCRGRDFEDLEDGRVRCLGCKAVFWEETDSFNWEVRIPLVEIEYKETGRI